VGRVRFYACNGMVPQKCSGVLANLGRQLAIGCWLLVQICVDVVLSPLHREARDQQ